MLHCNEGWHRMAGGIVSVAQQKGGSGKTTLAVQLGVAWLGAGRRVAMLDIDPQASLFAWFNVRRRRFGEVENRLLVQGLSGWRLGGELRRLRREFDLIVVDSPAHAESDARAAIREADLALVPCQPNALDVWASAPTLELAQGVGTAALLVLNRVPPRGRAAEQMRAEIAAQRWPVAGALLGNRQAYAASIGEGRGVAETAPASAAGREIAALADEVLARLA
jgi:chromosome partitioning protein